MRLEAVAAKCESVSAIIRPCANEPRDTDDLSDVQMKTVKVHFSAVAAEQTALGLPLLQNRVAVEFVTRSHYQFSVDKGLLS